MDPTPIQFLSQTTTELAAAPCSSAARVSTGNERQLQHIQTEPCRGSARQHWPNHAAYQYAALLHSPTRERNPLPARVGAEPIRYGGSVTTASKRPIVGSTSRQSPSHSSASPITSRRGLTPPAPRTSRRPAPPGR